MAHGAGPAEIGVLVYPGVQLAAVHGLTDLFAIAGRLASAQRNAERAALRVTHWRVEADEGAVVCAYDSLPHGEPRPGVILIPPTLADLPAPEALAPLGRWVHAQHAGGAVVGSICSGAFILAQSGLLAGRFASTHWSCAEHFSERFPDVRVTTDVRLVDDGDVVTAGGFMAWVDVALRFVERLLGPAVAAETARFLTADPAVRSEPYLNGFTPRIAHGDAAILRAQHWVHGRDARRVSLGAMAAQAGLEKRTFLRRFVLATGVTPLEYCRNVRIGRARELLESSNKTQKVIAWEIGYEDPGAFARAFRKAIGLSPGSYRRRFRGRVAAA